MSTYRELVYMVMDKLKQNTDDTYFTEDHIIFLLDKYRNFLIAQDKSSDSELSEANYQTLCIPLVEVPPIIGEPCEGKLLLRSKDRLPLLLGKGITTVQPEDYFNSVHIVFTDKNRFKYTGENKYLKNIIYVTLYDRYLWLKSENPQFLYLQKVRMTGIFENAAEAAKYACEPNCDNLDSTFPIADDKIPQLLEFVYKELQAPVVEPEDKDNNAQDDKAPKTGGGITDSDKLKYLKNILK